MTVKRFTNDPYYVQQANTTNQDLLQNEQNSIESIKQLILNDLELIFIQSDGFSIKVFCGNQTVLPSPDVSVQNETVDPSQIINTFSATDNSKIETKLTKVNIDDFMQEKITENQKEATEDNKKIRLFPRLFLQTKLKQNKNKDDFIYDDNLIEKRNYKTSSIDKGVMSELNGESYDEEYFDESQPQALFIEDIGREDDVNNFRENRRLNDEEIQWTSEEEGEEIEINQNYESEDNYKLMV